jgi:hypothetical protein
MIASATSPRPARAGLLIIALLHFLAAALPFAHAHALPASAGQAVTSLDDDRERSAHSALCTACRTLAGAHTAPTPAAVSARPPHVESLALPDDTGNAPIRILPSAQPRAPPHA